MSDEKKKAVKKQKYEDRILLRKITVKYRTDGKKLKVIYPDNTQEVLEDKFIADETSKTGLRWTYSKNNKIRFRGMEAGSLRHAGASGGFSPYYGISLYINKVLYRMRVSRIVWMLAYKDKPIGNLLIDHEDRNPLNNKVSNLRLSTERQNSTNKGCRAKSGYKNVVADRKCFIFKIRVNGKDILSSTRKSKHEVLLLGWEILTSGEIPLDNIEFQPKEYMDGTYLRQAMDGCEKAGISFTIPKFKTLHEYIASVEGSC